MFFDDYAYPCIRLFDFQARDCYHSRNPIVKILMPKMNTDLKNGLR